MMDVKTILNKVKILESQGPMVSSISGLSQDSRRIQKDFAYVAVRGTVADGHQYIDAAIKNGATLIVCEEIPSDLHKDKSYVQVEDSREVLALMASEFYGQPSSKLTMIGFTGTNGKTSCATMAYQLFEELGHKCGLISTVKILVGREERAARLTTPDPVELNQVLAEMVDEGCTHCFMEASSHALDQKRVFGIDFRVAVFTNISHDHLDYHGDFKSYIKAKKILFDGLSDSSWALINIDDKNGGVMVQNTGANVRTYALKKPADFKGKVMSNSFQGLEMQIDGKEIHLPLVGKFNAYNLLSVYAVAILAEEDPDEVLLVLSRLIPPAGRFEVLPNPRKVHAIVDYAHTPDALKNVLETIKEIRTGNENLITVFGCGGDRDKGKRPEMAKVAAGLSDKVILTSDNPRTEDPEMILEEIEKGIPASASRKFLKQSDRREAIKTACMLAEEGDILLLAGKGHETYQEIMGERFHFDDKEELNNCLNPN